MPCTACQQNGGALRAQQGRSAEDRIPKPPVLRPLSPRSARGATAINLQTTTRLRELRPSRKARKNQGRICFSTCALYYPLFFWDFLLRKSARGLARPSPRERARGDNKRTRNVRFLLAKSADLGQRLRRIKRRHYQFYLVKFWRLRALPF